MQFLFVWLIYYTFSCVILFIYWFLNRFLHERLVHQNFRKRIVVAKFSYLNLYSSFWFSLFQSFILQTKVYIVLVLVFHIHIPFYDLFLSQTNNHCTTVVFFFSQKKKVQYNGFPSNVFLRLWLVYLSLFL